ncbi:unnamed protein product, partial [Allacma fusca]
MAQLLVRLKKEHLEHIDTRKGEKATSAKAFHTDQVKTPHQAGTWNDQQQQKRQIKCFNCGKIGHIKRDCRSAQTVNTDHGNRSGQPKAFMGKGSIQPPLDIEWILDSVSTGHICGDIRMFSSFEKFQEPHPVYLTTRNSVNAE